MVKDEKEKKKVLIDKDELIAILRMLEAVKRKLQNTLK
jgi:tetrahydromethanopterin S-methyltransferase subunit G